MVMNWDELRTFLAVVRSGSIRRGARALGVNHGTVSRRLQAFQQTMGSTLLEREDGRLVLTAAGEDLHRTALAVEEQMLAVSRRVAGGDQKLSGTLRVTLSEPLFAALAADFASFSNSHPEIRLEFVTGIQYINLSRRDADLALRISNTPPPNLIGSKLCEVGGAFYASQAYLRRAGPRALENYDWIGWDESLSHLPGARWMHAGIDAERIRVCVDNPVAMEIAIRGGLGVGLLTCMTGDALPTLTRLSPPSVELIGNLWLLVHRDLRHLARIRVLHDFLATRIRAQRDRLTGQSLEPRNHGSG